MNIHYLQHVPFEGLGSIEPWSVKNGHRLTRSRLYLNDNFPLISNIDWLIIMGGPMSVNDTIAYPWLNDEMAFIEQAIAAQKTILGICLGAQLIAGVLGSKVYPNSQKEIGWFQVEKVKTARESKIGKTMADVITPFHWHGETFDLPPGAVHLAESRACELQAFVYKDRVIGLQYHLETTMQTAKMLIQHCSHEIEKAPYIQSRSKMLAEPSHFTKINREMERLLDYLQRATIN